MEEGTTEEGGAGDIIITEQGEVGGTTTIITVGEDTTTMSDLTGVAGGAGDGDLTDMPATIGESN